MARLLLIIILVQTFAGLSQSEVIPVFDEVIQDCTTPDTKAGFFDFSGLEIIAENDTHAYLNGSWKFLKEVSSPWVYVIYTERFERGQWNLFAFNKRVPDFCKVIHSPTEPWYMIYKNVPGCPLKAGVGIIYRFDEIADKLYFIRSPSGTLT